MNIRVSYIAATRNRRLLVAEALPRWRELKDPQDELIVVDGASTDGTYELLRDAEPGLIDELIHEPDRCESHAFNKGFLLARGLLIKPLTDDDVFYREGLEKAYQVMLAHPQIDILNTGGEHRHGDGNGRDEVTSYQRIASDRDSYWHVRQCGVGMIIRRTSLALIGLLDTRHFFADTSLLLQAHQRGAHISFLQVKTYQYRCHADSGIRKVACRRHRMARRMFADYGLPAACWLPSLYPRLWKCLRGVREPKWGARNLLQTVRNYCIGRPQPCEPVWDGQLYH